jgi:hypothetical protein
VSVTGSVFWSGGGTLRDFRGDPSSVSVNVHGVCHLKGGVVRWWEVESIQM